MGRATDRVEPRGETIKQRREDLGYSQRVLAKMVDLSERTIQFIEASEATSYQNIIAIAAALDIDDPATLIVGEPPVTIPKRTKGGRTTVFVRLDIATELINDPLVEDLIYSITRAAHALHAIQIKQRKASSILVTLEMDSSDVAKLIRALNDGLLAQFKCPSIILPYTSFAAVLPLIGLATLIGLASIGLLAPWMIPVIAGSYAAALRLRFPNLSVRPVADGLELTYSPRKRTEPDYSPTLSTHESIFDKLFGKRLKR